MNMSFLRCVFLLMLFATLCYCFPRRCRHLADCKCGEYCVKSDRNVRCMRRRDCVCKTGCLVFNTFIPAGQNKPVHCNRCSCPENPQLSKGIPGCTRRSWCNIPPRTDVYLNNPHCGQTG
ncbi:uncharacterized protein LOC128220061 [Mya arenaria]|uniref:uncharacterized protein LOC128220061 n=1 Tax=Mya arenaria TaxID=6604 RepID=UPI0022E2238E|nr:uncharacterized protein LOC128220061 [Mya arenaria]